MSIDPLILQSLQHLILLLLKSVDLRLEHCLDRFSDVVVELVLSLILTLHFNGFIQSFLVHKVLQFCLQPFDLFGSLLLFVEGGLRVGDVLLPPFIKNAFFVLDVDLTATYDAYVD